MTSFKLVGNLTPPRPPTPNKLLYTAAELPNVVRLIDKIELRIEDWRMMFSQQKVDRMRVEAPITDHLRDYVPDLKKYNAV